MIKRIINNSILVVSLTLTGVVVAMIIMAYVWTIARPVIDASVLGSAYVIGYGGVVLALVAMICVTGVVLSVSGRVIGGQWFSYLVMRSGARKALLESEFEFRTLEAGQQGYLFTRPDSQLVGRPVLETGPFTANSQTTDSVSLAKWQLLNAPRKYDGVPLIEAPQSPPPQSLLTALDGCANILIIGGKGSGKTALQLWIEHKLIQAGELVVVLDSHSQPGKWAGHTIGCGRDFQSIALAMQHLNNELDNRYKTYSAGNNDFTPMNVFIDEFTLLPPKLKNIGFDIQTYSKPALTEGRKVGLNCIWGIHSDRAAALGLQGAKDLLECFDAIVYLKKVQQNYYGLINFGEGVGDVRYAHPGPFTVNRPARKPKILTLPAAPAATDSATEPEQEPEPDKAATIRSLHAAGKSNQQIAEHFGLKSCSGRFYYELREALSGKK